MLTHVVLMQLHPDAATADIADLERRLRELSALLVRPGSCTVGPNVTSEPFARGFDFGFVIRFPDTSGLAIYHNHLDHQPISELVHRLSQTFLVFDFEGP